MPLKKGKSKAAFAENMHTLKSEGYPQKQRLAIALSKSGRSKKGKRGKRSSKRGRMSGGRY
jgi:hypothetical protein